MNDFTEKVFLEPRKIKKKLFMQLEQKILKRVEQVGKWVLLLCGLSEKIPIERFLRCSYARLQYWWEFRRTVQWKSIYTIASCFACLKRSQWKNFFFILCWSHSLFLVCVVQLQRVMAYRHIFSKMLFLSSYFFIFQ